MTTHTLHNGKLHIIGGMPRVGKFNPIQEKAYIVVLDDNTKEMAIANTLQGCSDAIRKYISDNDLGASTFYGGTILHPTKGAFAHVSYNGRVWEGLTYVPNGKEYKGDELLKTLN